MWATGTPAPATPASDRNCYAPTTSTVELFQHRGRLGELQLNFVRDAMRRLVRALFTSIFLFTSVIAWADASDRLSRLEGYTIVLATYIKGYQDEDGKKEDSFNGCNFGRTIIFDNNKVLTCSSYSYTYSYHPSAVIFVKGADFKMLVGNELYDMRR